MPLHNIGADGHCTCRPTKHRPKAHIECPTPGKHPRIKTGRAFAAATTDEAQIRQWWAKWPAANIGIATGQGSQLAVVDIDGQKGFDTLARVIAEHGGGEQLPMTLTARSGRDGPGAHLYFLCEAPSPSNSGDGLDIRGDGGNLVAPPSMHVSGRPYAWVNAIAPAPMPPWLLHWFQNRDREARRERLVNQQDAFGADKEVHGLPEHLRGRAGAGLSRRPVEVELTPIADVESALEAIPNESLSWDAWNRVGMAVWRATGGSDEGLDAFDYWSQKSRKYEPEAAEERWRAYSGSPPDSIGFGSLWYEAKQADPAWLPPSQQRVEAIPLEQRAFTPDHSIQQRSGDTNGHHVNGHSGVAQLFVPKTPADPLIELNEKFAVIGDIGGKCRVLGWVPSKVDPRVKIPSFQDFKAFSERFGARYIEVEVEKKNGDVEVEHKQIGAYWLKWSGRKSYEGIDLSPNAPPILEGNILNLWSGFAVQPAPGRWDRMREHITDVLANGDTESAAYILKFAAWCLQHPGERAEVALVFRGEKGSGKGTFARALKDIFGQHGLHIFSAKHLTGNFNAHLRTCLLLFSDEAFWAGDKQGESTLKGLLTEPTMMIEQKGVDASPWRNRLKVIMAANNEWVVPAGPMERRYAVFNVGESRVQDYAYFKRLNAELEAGGLAAMAHDLVNLELDGWHPRDVIKTEALLEQKRQSMSPLQEWFCSILDDGVIPGAGESDQVHIAALHRQAQESWQRMRDVSPVAMGRFLKKHGCYAIHTAKGTAWRFPRLADLRAKWVKAYGGQWAWDEELSDWRRR